MTRSLAVTATVAWVVATLLVLGDGANGQLGETGHLGYLVGMMATALSIAAWMERWLRAVEAGFDAGRRSATLQDDRSEPAHGA